MSSGEKKSLCSGKLNDDIFADQQDSETTNLVRQHQEALREAQEGMKEKAAELEAVSQDYNNKLKVEMLGSCIRSSFLSIYGRHKVTSRSNLENIYAALC